MEGLRPFTAGALRSPSGITTCSITMGRHSSATIHIHFSERSQRTMSVLHDRKQAAFDPKAHGIQCLFQVILAVFPGNAQALSSHDFRAPSADRGSSRCEKDTNRCT